MIGPVITIECKAKLYLPLSIATQKVYHNNNNKVENTTYKLPNPDLDAL
jgi:hypothetical protein